MTEELVRAYGRKINTLTLQPVSGGVFEVSYNGEIIFSKEQLDRFPEPGEVTTLIDERRR